MILSDPIQAQIFKAAKDPNPFLTAEALVQEANKTQLAAGAEIAGCLMIAAPGDTIQTVIEAWRTKTRIVGSEI